MEHTPRIAILVARLTDGPVSCLASLNGQRGFHEDDLFLATGTDWAETLNRAWETAIATERDYDAFLWIDEDLILDHGALDRLFADAVMVANPHEPLVIAGAVLAPSRDRPVGGAFVQRDPAHPLELDLIRADRVPQMAASVSGEAVLVTRAAHAELGILDAGLDGPRAALDYGLRAYEAGVPVMLAGEPVGVLASERKPIVWSEDAAIASRHAPGLLERVRNAFGL